MQIAVYAIFDTKAATFSQPSFFANDAMCLRALLIAASEPSSMLSKFPDDYIIFCIGEYDDSIGNLSSPHPPRNLGPVRSLFADRPTTIDN